VNKSEKNARNGWTMRIPRKGVNLVWLSGKVNRSIREQWKIHFVNNISSIATTGETERIF
jgi:hypothetical protein